MKSLGVCANRAVVVFVVVMAAQTVCVEGRYTVSERRMISAENRALKGFGYQTKTVNNHVVCGRDCSTEINCKSFNFYDDRICELNNATREEYPGDFIVDQASVYFDTNDETSLLALDDNTLRNFKTCSTLLDAGYKESAVYTIYPNGFAKGVRVFCDMDADGGGWIVFQRRLNGSVDFYRNWTEYQSGFGDLSTEFWLGNDNLVGLTADGSNGTWELRVDLVDGSDNTARANYKEFQVLSEPYVLNIGEYDKASTAGESFQLHNGLPFTTKDRDNDIEIDENCAVRHEGGWWYRRCVRCDLNSKYSPNWETVDGKGIVWKSWQESTLSLKKTSMKIRQTNKRINHYRSCKDLQRAGFTSNRVYKIYPQAFLAGLLVYCDMETDGGGWIVFQRRSDDSTNFYQTWDIYQYFFGNIKNFWLGNEHLVGLTSDESHGTWELRVDLQDGRDDSTAWAKYSDFKIVGANYTLQFGRYDDSSTANDSLFIHRGRPFSTKDNDNDVDSENCAVKNQGAWWFRTCLQCHLNSVYLSDWKSDGAKGIKWKGWTGPDVSLKSCSMKIRETD